MGENFFRKHSKAFWKFLKAFWTLLNGYESILKCSESILKGSESILKAYESFRNVQKGFWTHSKGFLNGFWTGAYGSIVLIFVRTWHKLHFTPWRQNLLSSPCRLCGLFFIDSHGVHKHNIIICHAKKCLTMGVWCVRFDANKAVRPCLRTNQVVWEVRERFTFGVKLWHQVTTKPFLSAGLAKSHKEMTMAS